MRVFLIGASGGIGRLLSARLSAAGDRVSGMHRRPDQARSVADSGAEPVAGDLIADSVERLAELMRDHDAVVFSAGAHGTGMDQTTLIDGAGLRKAAAAAELAGLSRFVLVSAMPESGRGGQPVERFEHYMRVKKEADVHLVGTGLDWLIVRPGPLVSEPADGCLTAGPAVQEAPVRRGNVAAFIAAALAEPRLSRRIVELTDGPTPAAQAVAGLVATGC